MRKIYIWDEESNTFIPYEQKKRERTHYVIEDTMSAAKHPCTGEYMDSKSRFRETTKAHGCIEIGNEKITDRVDRAPKGVREDLLKTMEGYGRG